VFNPALALYDSLVTLMCRQVAHLGQHFRGAAGFAAGTPLGQRSFLGGLLPESLLHILTSYGAGAFAAALVGDSDTPELVWTHRMRAQRLVPQARCFPSSLTPEAHAVTNVDP
jgi:DnaJ family protein C protein 13